MAAFEVPGFLEADCRLEKNEVGLAVTGFAFILTDELVLGLLEAFALVVLLGLTAFAF